MNKIRIAFFISNLGQGGAEKQFYTLVSKLNGSIFEKHLYLYAYQNEAFYKEIFDLSDVVVSTNKLKNKQSLLKILEAGLYIRKVLRYNQYDLVVSTLFMNNFLVRLFGLRYYKNKFISNVRTSFKAYNRTLLFAEKQQIRHSHLVFNSRNAYSSFMKLMPAKYHPRLSYIYNGFEVPGSINTPGQTASVKIIIGCLGRMNVEKNFIQVVRVFQNIEKANPFICLIIQGNQGNQYEQIITEINSEKIEIREKNTDIEPFYNTIRILVIPSFYEGCPNVLFEALLRRKLCIVSSGANSDGFITDNENGFIYNGTDEDLAKILIKAFGIIGTDKETALTENGLRYAKENFSSDAMIKKYEELFLIAYEENKSCL